MTIAYAAEPDLKALEFEHILVASTLAERRPADDAPRLQQMLDRADIIIAAGCRSPCWNRARRHRLLLLLLPVGPSGGRRLSRPGHRQAFDRRDACQSWQRHYFDSCRGAGSEVLLPAYRHDAPCAMLVDPARLLTRRPSRGERRVCPPSFPFFRRREKAAITRRPFPAP